MLGAELGLRLGDFGQVVVEDALKGFGGAERIHFPGANDAHVQNPGRFRL